MCGRGLARRLRVALAGNSRDSAGTVGSGQPLESRDSSLRSSTLSVAGEP